MIKRGGQWLSGAELAIKTIAAPSLNTLGQEAHLGSGVIVYTPSYCRAQFATRPMMTSWRGELCNQNGQLPLDSSSPGCIEKMVHGRHTILPD
ncbi:Uncharacterized protein HZ326_26000 [Fusarium oxysporum f. sp. albedinis]|nr:Uncharacterized protein HZ326_26000 [Fusarium oxysporum f. sp. albedinis]